MPPSPLLPLLLLPLALVLSGATSIYSDNGNLVLAPSPVANASVRIEGKLLVDGVSVATQASVEAALHSLESRLALLQSALANSDCSCDACHSSPCVRGNCTSTSSGFSCACVPADTGPLCAGWLARRFASTAGANLALDVQVVAGVVYFLGAFVGDMVPSLGVAHRGDLDVVVIKLSEATGDILGTYSLGTHRADVAYGMVVDEASDSLFLCGYTGGNMTADIPDDGAIRAFMARLSLSSGTPLWIKEFPDAEAFLYSLHLHAGTLYSGGQMRASSFLGQSGDTVGDALLLSVNASDGNVLYLRTYASSGSLGDFFLASVLDTANDLLVLGGGTHGDLGGASEGSIDILLTSVRASSGALLQHTHLGTTALERIYSMAIDPAGQRLFIVGEAKGPLLGSSHDGNFFLAGIPYAADGALSTDLSSVWTRTFEGTYGIGVSYSNVTGRVYAAGNNGDSSLFVGVDAATNANLVTTALSPGGALDFGSFVAPGSTGVVYLVLQADSLFGYDSVSFSGIDVIVGRLDSL